MQYFNQIPNSFISNNGYSQTFAQQQVNGSMNNFQKTMSNQQQNNFCQNYNQINNKNFLTLNSFQNQNLNSGLTLSEALQKNSLPAPQVLDPEILEEELPEDGTIKFDWV